MKLKMQLKSLAFIYNLINNNSSCILPSDKPIFTPSASTVGFPEALPEQEGVRSSGLLDMFSVLSADRRINPHSAVILRNGKLIAKAEWTPYTADLPHVSHSLAKSVTSMALGIAEKEKYISVGERLGDIFDTDEKAVRDITVHELLTMSSGVKFNEAGSLMSKNWCESFLASDLIFEHGTKFHYNSMNTYMLSAALCKRTGTSLSEYISRRLFTPMGIEKFFWEKCPSGIEKGGWGLYLTAYDYAKLGQLWLENGKWNGTQLIPQEWVSKASSVHISRKDLCPDGYGYQVWLGRHGVIFSGMFGQLVYIVPKQKMVIALTAGSENLFPCGYALNHINAFLGTAEYFSKSPFTRFHYAGTASLRKALSSAKFGAPLELAGKTSLISRLRQLFVTNTASPEKVLDGVKIVFEKNRGHLLPLLIQIMEGCFGQGIEQISFSVKKQILNMHLFYKDSSAVIPLGFGTSENCIYKGYAVASQAFFTTDEDELPVLKIQLCFLESSCTKILKFIFDDEGVTLKIRESPKLYGALDEISALAAPQLGSNIRRTIEAVLETDIADYKIKSFIEPTIRGSLQLSTKGSANG
ncbi:MAG: serine hydrolase [Oscillospiraceae bacterium]|nr:serine hydrolase [Oscillospiraceae bacterium]